MPARLLSDAHASPVPRMRNGLRGLLLLVAALVPFVDVLVATPQATAKPRKVAFLVGVGAFKFDPSDLKGSPQKDVTALAEVLREGGFEVVVLTDGDATKAAIEKRFQALLDGDGDAAKAITNADLLLVGVCTHGFTLPPAAGKPDAPFLAAHDSKLEKPDTMVSLNGLIDGGKSSGATVLYLIDACREVPADANRGTRGVEGTEVKLPKQTAMLFSCRRGQVAHQSDKTGGHGLFTFAVLNALRTDAGPKDDVSWTELVAGVQKSFRTPEFKAIMGGKPQVPVLSVGGEFDDAHLMELKPGSDPKVGDVREFEVADGVKMKFCWIPAPDGDVQLGSPKAEQDYITKTFFDGKRPDYLDDESEGAQKTYTSKKEFWLGKYEVTQDEWVAVMKVENPSYFDGKKDNKSKGEKTGRYPVEQVSWDDICGKDGAGGTGTFLGKVRARPGASKAFGKAGRFVLPTEAEWEYACRGGKGNGQAFYWGSVLNGNEANCDGNYPYGTTDIGKRLGRTCPVEFDNDWKYKVHPWGLMHMHGNVSEWCENKYKQSDIHRVLRGGLWLSRSHICRAAYRSRRAPDYRNDSFGFRLCFRLD